MYGVRGCHPTGHGPAIRRALRSVRRPEAAADQAKPESPAGDQGMDVVGPRRRRGRRRADCGIFPVFVARPWASCLAAKCAGAAAQRSDRWFRRAMLRLRFCLGVRQVIGWGWLAFARTGKGVSVWDVDRQRDLTDRIGFIRPFWNGRRQFKSERNAGRFWIFPGLNLCAFPYGLDRAIKDMHEDKDVFN